MLELENRIVYFERAGKFNTEKTLTLAKERAEELNIRNVVLASSSGYTAKKALEVFNNTDIRLIVIGTSRNSFSEELLNFLESNGIPVRFSREVEYSYPETIQNAFRKLSEGLKVVVQLGMIITEESIVPENEEVVAIAGTGPTGFEDGGGADTAVVMIPRRSEKFYSLIEKNKRRDIKEIICKPR